MQAKRPGWSELERGVSPRRYQVARCTLWLVVWIAMIAAVVAADDALELRLASDRWPPFTGEAGTQRVAIELVHTALDHAGIRNATYDGSSAMWRSEKREQDLLFSEPYLENRLVLVGRKGSDVTAARMSDLAGKRVAGTAPDRE